MIGLHEDFTDCQSPVYTQQPHSYIGLYNSFLRECENVSRGLFKNQISSCKWGNNHSNSVWETDLITQGIQKLHRELI